MFCFLIFYVLSCYFFFPKFYITFTISFRRKKNRCHVMTNFIFRLSTSRHRLNQVDLQKLWHCDGTRPMKNSPHCHFRRFSLHTEFRQNTISTNGQPSVQLFPKRWPLSNQTRTKSIINKHKVKPHRNSDTKTGNREQHTNHRLGTVSNEFLGRGLKPVLCAEPHPP